jgi:hypothetical protein
MIFVTGGTGLVGSHLILDLLRSGEKVRALKRNSSDTTYITQLFSFHGQEKLLDSLEWWDGDLFDVPSLNEGIAGAEHVYHRRRITIKCWISMVPEREILSMPHWPTISKSFAISARLQRLADR